MRITSDDPPRRQRPPLTKRMGPKHWAALDYVAGGLTTVVLFTTIRRGLRAAQILPPIPSERFYPLPMAGAIAALLVVAAGLAVALRRRRPVFMLGVLLAGSLFLTSLTGPEVGAPLAYCLPVAYVLYLVAATYERRRDAVRALAAVFATLLANTALLAIGWGGWFNQGGLISVSLCVIVVWTIGYTVRQRRRYAVSLQEEAASKAVAQERLRIARELHDVVAHSMSVIAVQAGYGQYVIDSQPGDARAALGAIQATSREALDEMRRMLGALRQADDADVAGAGTRPTEAGAAAGTAGAGAAGAGVARAGAGSRAVAGSGAVSDVEPGSGARSGARAGFAGGPGAPLFPAPGLADLDRLVGRTSGAGVRVDVKRFGQPRDLPASIDLSAYRIIQEALTNVVKHAQTGSCRVLIGYRDDDLTIEVTDDGAGMPVPELAGAGAGASRHAVNGTASRGVGLLDGAPTPRDIGLAASALGLPGAGHGIIGMRERVTLLGGEFSAGPLPGYGFRVSARIPLQPSSA